ncbi:MAG: hypothetical protein ACRD4L_03970 [Pyrinomonadaceae bacterium]
METKPEIKSLTDLPAWEEFKAEAKKRRRNPVKVLAEYMKECIETWQHQQLDNEIRSDAQKSGYTEEDAVELVRQYRQEKYKRASS